MNLVEYITNNINDYHYSYYTIYKNKVECVLKKLNVEVSDINDAIFQWKELLYPILPPTLNWKEGAEFYILCFYLQHNRFIVKGHPFFLSKIQSFDDYFREITYSTVLKFGESNYGSISIESRTRYIKELEIVKDEGFSDLLKFLNSESKLIASGRNSDFSQIPTNSKLARIAVFFEHLMVLNDKYLPLYFNKISSDVRDETNIRVLQSELNVFLQDDLKSLDRRKSYSYDRKSYLLSYSLKIINTIKPYLLNKNNRYFYRPKYCIK